MLLKPRHGNFKRIQYAAGSRCVILSTKHWVYKIPWGISGHRRLIDECRQNSRACKDHFWCDYVVRLETFGPSVRSRRLKKKVGSEDEVIRKLMAHHRDIFSDAEMGEIDQIAPCPNIKKMVIPRLSAVAQDNFRNYRNHARIPGAPSHGDLHRGNLFMEGDRIKIIDWAGFQAKFWRDYDLFHLLFCDVLEREGGRWIELAIYLRDMYGGPATSLGEGWSGADLIHYLVCRCEMELAQDIALNRLCPRRLEKYSSALETFFDK